MYKLFIRVHSEQERMSLSCIRYKSVLLSVQINRQIVAARTGLNISEDRATIRACTDPKRTEYAKQRILRDFFGSLFEPVLY